MDIVDVIMGIGFSSIAVGFMIATVFVSGVVFKDMIKEWYYTDNLEKAVSVIIILILSSLFITCMGIVGFMIENVEW